MNVKNPWFLPGYVAVPGFVIRAMTSLEWKLGGEWLLVGGKSPQVLNTRLEVK